VSLGATVRAVRTRAVIFDFFGTLSISPSASARRAGAARIAAVMGISPDVFHDVVISTFSERATGACGDLEHTMRWLARRCGHEPTDEQLVAACAIRRATEAGYVRALRSDAEPTLRQLKRDGFKVGLVSDCTHELPEIWPSLPIAAHVDAVVFSIQIGQRKPHPDLYAAVTGQLGVAPAECVYIGDGGSSELTGATVAGMTAYQLLAADAADAIIYDAESGWHGATIGSLTDVLRIVSN
jgi:putative hydrolase of the HAD superfamily